MFWSPFTAAVTATAMEATKHIIQYVFAYRYFTYEIHMEMEHFHIWNFNFTYKIRTLSHMKCLIHLKMNWFKISLIKWNIHL